MNSKKLLQQIMSAISVLLLLAGCAPAATPTLTRDRIVAGVAEAKAVVATTVLSSTSLPADRSEPSPTATATSKPTDTPRPTATYTPTPTETPQPTATYAPAPTSTLQPTATPVPSPEQSVVLVKATWVLLGEKVTVKGTGIVYDHEGLVLTAAHVVDGASIIKVNVPGHDRDLPVRLEGINPCQDLAMLRIAEGGPFVPSTFGTSSSVHVNHEVRVLGYSGDAETSDDLTVTRGIVSRVGVEGSTITGLTYYDLIRTDADTESGNSGGPLVVWEEGEDKGKVVGVVLLESDGQGHAVPIDSLTNAIAELAHGEKEHWIGGLMIPLRALHQLSLGDRELQEMLEMAELLELPGMFIFGVYPDSVADRAGLRSFDMLWSMRGIEIDSMDELCDIMETHEPPYSVVVMRDEQELSFELWGESPSPDMPASTVTPTPPPCLSNATFVKDVAVLDGTQFAPGESFEKAWRMRSSGCAPWPQGSRWVFVSGTKLGAPDWVAVPETALGGTADIRVPMQAPATPRHL